ncbi:MAG: RNA 2',3'-cyclic phosphodiesterase [Ignavibacteriales bacterium]|nr:RNA 2',3'-cyclic phosphodiesterase [Ignavibacteriales bacterium]
MPLNRAFIALPLPAEIRREFATLQKQLIESQADVKWDTSDKFHITLKFLGDVESSQPGLLAKEVQNSIGTFRHFDLSFVTLGAFPNPGRPRVVWIGSEQNEDVTGLQRSVEMACSSFGFAKEDRPFHAHVTLGRVKGDRNIDRLTAKLKSITFKPLIARCTEVHIIRSELKPAGSVYTLLNSIPLAS